MRIELKDKVVLITGGSRGIGKTACKVFLDAGARVVTLCRRRPEELIRNVDYYYVDITDNEMVPKTIGTINRIHGSIDILINNAGIIKDKSFFKMDSEVWDSVINTNLNGTFNVTKAVLPYMKEKGFGRVINTSSIVGSMGAFGQTNYATTKAGVVGFTKSLSKEVGKYNITVNAVAPGYIRTEMTETIPQQYIDNIVSQTPVGRLGTTEEVAQAYLYLASDAASFITGTTLHINGGMYTS